MAALRHMLLLLGASFFIACLAGEVAGPPTAPVEKVAEPATSPVEKVAAPATSPVEEVPASSPAEGQSQPTPTLQEVLKAKIWAIIGSQHYQWVIALFAIVFGVAALFDGKAFFRILVCMGVYAITFTLVLSELKISWIGGVAREAKYIVSLEAGAFVAFAAHKGWDGTQLLLGLAIGMYMFQCEQAVAQTIPYIDVASNHSIWITIVCTLMVAFGVWMMHERYGAGRVLGVLCPLLGGSLIVATCGYFWMLACTLPQLGKVLHVTVPPSDVPSVFEFWYMIVFPIHSHAVGFFNFTNKYIEIPPRSGNKLDIDKALGLIFWAIITALGIWRQLKADSDARAKTNDALNVRLLSRAAGSPPNGMAPAPAPGSVAPAPAWAPIGGLAAATAPIADETGRGVLPSNDV